MTYRYGSTHEAMSMAARHRIARLERQLRERDHRITTLESRLNRRKAAPVNLEPVYRDALTEDELRAPPVLWPGDTPEICAARLAAVNAESDERASRNISAANTRRAAA